MKIALTLMETATRRSSRGAAILQKPGLPALNDDKKSTSSDFPLVRDLAEYVKAEKNKASNTRDSISSASVAESSGYSTPGTSAAPTPAIQVKSSTKRRGRPPANMDAESATPAVNAVARAAALRNSQFSLNSTNKRKRVPDSDEDLDEDDTPDAQLARALQDQENAAGELMMVDDEDEDIVSRRTPRKSQRILPKADFASDFEEEDLGFVKRGSTSRLAKRPKVELGSKGSNAVAFSASRKPIAIEDSEESDDFVETVDSDEESDIAPLPKRGSAKPVSKSTPKTMKVDDSDDDSEDVPLSVARRGKSAASAKNSTPASKAKPVGRASESSAKRSAPKLSRKDTEVSTVSGFSLLTESEFDSDASLDSEDYESDASSDVVPGAPIPVIRGPRRRVTARQQVNLDEDRMSRRTKKERARLELHHPELHTMWQDLANLPKIGDGAIEQPKNITRELKPFQLQGVAWMQAMEKTAWGGGLLGDEMGMGKTIQAVSLIMSDWPAKQPSLVLIPPVALMQWQQEIADYTDGTLKTFVFHGTNPKVKGVTYNELMEYDVILLSYNSLESMYRKQEKGFKRKDKMIKEKSMIHKIHFHRVILDEAHSIKVCCTNYLGLYDLANINRHAPLVLPRLASL